MMNKNCLLILFFIALFINACAAGKRVATVDPHKKTPYTVDRLGEVKVANKKLYGFILEWEGTPYRFAGLSKSGIDCSGLVFLLMRDVYSKKVPRNTSALANNSIRVDNMQEGDLVFFDIDGKKHSHVGVYIQENKFVHASSKAGVTISCLTNPYFKSHFAYAGRIK